MSPDSHTYALTPRFYIYAIVILICTVIFANAYYLRQRTPVVEWVQVDQREISLAAGEPYRYDAPPLDPATTITERFEITAEQPAMVRIHMLDMDGFDKITCIAKPSLTTTINCEPVGAGSAIEVVDTRNPQRAMAAAASAWLGVKDPLHDLVIQNRIHITTKAFMCIQRCTYFRDFMEEAKREHENKND